MELVRTKKSEEVVFGKGFVPVLAAFFAGTEEEIAQFNNLKKSGGRIHIIIDPTGTATLNGEEMRSFEKSVTGEAMLEPLPAEGPPPGETAPEPMSARRLGWRPLYQLAAASLLVMVALGLFILSISGRAPWQETRGKGTGTVFAEKDSTLPVLAKQNQGLVPVPSTPVKRERPHRLAHNRRDGADPNALLLKQDTAWRISQR